MAATRNSLSTDLQDAVAACIGPRLAQGHRVCVALSGGRDSVALLHVLLALRGQRFPELEISALHVHHGLSPNADRWADFCAGLCRDLGVPFRCEHVSVARDSGDGIEAAARAARYQAFSGCAADWLLQAHHRDDQAETLLLNLLRGAGACGLAGMPEERLLAGGVRLLRPFLRVPRAAIEAWHAANAGVWEDDESNADTGLRRNFLRHEVLPLLGRQFPDPARALAGSAAHLRSLAQLAEEVAEADAEGAIDGASLAVVRLNALPPLRRGNLLRYFLRRQGVRMPDARFLDEMLRQLAMAGADTAPRFSVDGVMFELSRGRLWRYAVSTGGECVPLRWNGAARVPWGGGCVEFEPCVGEGLSQAALEVAGEAVCLRLRQGGERLRTDLRRPSRPLKKLLQEAGVPQWQRRQMPLLWVGDSLIWAAVAGYAADSGYLAAADEAGWRLRWNPGSANSGG